MKSVSKNYECPLIELYWIGENDVLTASADVNGKVSIQMGSGSDEGWNITYR